MNKRIAVALLVIAAIGAGAWQYTGRGHPLVNAPAPAGPIVAFGDSLTQGVGDSAGEAYPAQLAALLGRPVINAGIGGNRVADGASRLERDVLHRKPGMVILLLGGNDLLQRGDMAGPFAALEGMVKQIQGTGAMAVVVGLDSPLPFSGVAGKYRGVARRTGALYIPNILGGIMGDSKLMADPIHPNAQGNKIMAERIAGAIRPHLHADE